MTAVTITRSGLEQVATLLAGSLSEGRRRRAVLDGGPARAFQTDLATIAVPLPMPGEHSLRALTCALALQSSPSKEAVAGQAWTALPRRARLALAWEEGEASVRWAGRRWPGLGDELERLFGPVSDEEPQLDGAALLDRARAREGAGEPPPLFGRLPLPRPRRPDGAATGRRTSIATRWSSRHRARRAGAHPIPVGGPGTEPVLQPGDPGTMEALDGRSGHAIGIPYDEWDYVRGAYRRGHVRVVELPTRPGSGTARAPLRLSVLAPERHVRRGLEQGELVDIDAVVRWRCELATGTSSSDPRLFAQLAPRPAPVAWALLVDASASSSLRGGDVLRRALEQADALAHALDRRGERVAAYAFCSHGRERVELRVLKDFDRPYAPFAALRPGGYTRLGAALRHAGERLLATPAHAHVLLSLGDGLPYDEGYGERYGEADVTKAVGELRERGARVLHGALASRDDAALRAMFGRAGWQRIDRPDQLRRLVGEVCAEIRRDG